MSITLAGAISKIEVKGNEEKKAEATQYLAEIDRVLDNLQYVGFDPVALRKSLKSPDFKVIVVRLLSAYVQIGSKITNALKDKRKVKMDLSDDLRKVKTTLSRLAIAYMPMVYVIRSRGLDTKAIIPQFPTDIVPAVFHDPCLCAVSNNYDFMIRFDRALSRTGNQNNHGEEVVRRYIEIAKKGLQADESVRTLFADGNLNLMKIVAWFESQFQ